MTKTTATVQLDSENLLPQQSIKNSGIVLVKGDEVEAEDSSETTDYRCDQLSYGDAVFATFLVAPLVVGVWRSTWGIMEIHKNMFPYAQIYVLGIIIHTSFALLRAYLLSRSTAPSTGHNGKFRWFKERVLSRIYTYIFVLSCIMHWRGGWGLFDTFVTIIVPGESDPHKVVLIAAMTLVFYVSTAFLRSARNILAPPYFLVTDGKEATYQFTTRFRKRFESSREMALYVLDCIFSVTIVGSLVVFVWRGSWALLDIFLYPDDQVRSFWASLIGGYVIVLITFSLQVPMRWAVARLHGAARLLLVDVYHLGSFVATVNVWRGVWGLLDVYYFPDQPKLSNWSTHIISFTLLILLNCSNTIIVRGVYIDAEEPAGDCVIFPCHYLRLFFHKERNKKRHRQALATAALATARKTEEASFPLQLPEEKV